VKIYLECSEAVAERHGVEPRRVEVPFDTSEGEWVQITYDSLRAQDGRTLAWYDYDTDLWRYGDQVFSDIIIEGSGL